MKQFTLILAALGLTGALAACTQKPAATAEAPAPPAAIPASPPPGVAMASDAKMAKSTGTVTAVTADSVTIAHVPIPEVNWPAMTMGFKASPDVAKSVKVGDRVAFDLKLQSGAGEVTAITKQ